MSNCKEKEYVRSEDSSSEIKCESLSKHILKQPTLSEVLPSTYKMKGRTT
jgi:hypothetical protein